MKKEDHTIFSDPSSQYIEKINGIHFTHREIDILAFLISGRSGKKIASCLAVSPKTVENHTRNIMAKIECNSKENIIDFVEKSNALFHLRKHYANLLDRAIFEKSLQVISKMHRGNNPASTLIFFQKKQLHNPFVSQLEIHLKLAGVPISLRVEENYKTLPELLERPDTGEFIIYVVPKDWPNKFGVFNKEEKITLQNSISGNRILFLLPAEDDIHKDLPYLLYRNSEEHQKYYLLFFKIIEKIFPTVCFDKIVSEFKENEKIIFEKDVSKYNQSFPVAANTLRKNRNFHFTVFKNSKKPNPLFLGLSFTIVVILVGFFSIREFNNHTSLNQKYSIRADLLIPTDSVFLERREQISQIDDKLKLQKQNGIRTIALAGIGGAGKTTLARQYVREKNAQVIWEINAETQESIKNSFEKLAHHLAKTEKDEKVLREVQEIKNPSEKEGKTIHFVQEHLKIQPNWFLVYDNVENFAYLQKYFPQDVKIWGQGTVILTTRNMNIQNNSLVNQVNFVRELSADQQLSLFTKIMTHGVTQTFTPLQQKEAIAFLKNIPPFPLDVTVAAYYLKSTNTNYKKYLENLENYNNEFASIEKKLLEESGTYPKTRYSIITLSLEQLIKSHKDFGELLLFISLLDSQNIPKDLLSKYKSDEVVDKFIFHLNKYSLVTKNSSHSFDSFPTLSIHRSTQEICLSYLTRVLNLKENHQLIPSVIHTIENYVADVIDKEDYSKVTLFSNHFEALLSHNNLLTGAINGSIKSELGHIYFFLGDYIKAKKLFKESIKHLTQYDTQNYVKIARVLMYLGEEERELGNIKEAKNLFEKSLGILRAHFPENRLEIAQVLIHLGIAYRSHGSYEQAKELCEQGYNIYKKHFAENHAGIVRVLACLGNINRNLGNYEHAKNLLEESLIIYKKYFSENNVGIARALSCLGMVYRDLGNYKKARVLLEKGLTIYKKHFSEDHIMIARASAFLGNVHRSLGDYELATSILEKSLLRYKKQLKEDHDEIAWALAHLGNIHKERGDYEKAKTLFEQSLTVYKKIFPDSHIDVAWILAHLGNIHQEMGNPERASQLLEQSLSAYKKYYSNIHVDEAWVLAHLGNSYRAMGNYEKAKSLLEKSLNIYKKIFGENNIRTSRVLAYLGNVYKDLGDFQTAKSLFEKSFIVHEKTYGKVHNDTARILENLGTVYFMIGKIESAEDFFNKSLESFIQLNHSEAYLPLERLAGLYINKSKKASNIGKIQESKFFKTKAIDYLGQALEKVKAHFPEDSPHKIRIELKLKELRPF